MTLARTVSIVFLFSALVFTARAGSVLLKNGDHLTGNIANSDGATLTLKTTYAGSVKIQWSAIHEVSSEKQIFVTTSDQKTLRGAITATDGTVLVHTASGSVSVPLAKVTSVRSDAGQAAYERSLHPPLTENWKGNVTFGFALARGNSDTTNLNTGLRVDRKTRSDHIALYESSLYATNDSAGGGVTADTVLGGARYDRNITPRLFSFVSGDFTHDDLQGLDLRSIFSGGLGWHAIDRPRTTLNLLAGVNYTHESYSGAAQPAPATGLHRNLAAMTVGNDFEHKLGQFTTFTEHSYFYPDLSNVGQYRFSLDAGSATDITNWLAWKVSFSDRYVSNPPIAGTESHDVIVSTGVDFKFSH
jgi:putative salt-induced outer membrane protein